jgi:hypothetical protein
MTGKQKHNKLFKTLIIIAVAIVTVLTIIFIFISPLTQYLVEKYDKAYTGREIKMDWAYVNPLTGYVYFDNIRIYEQTSELTGVYDDSIFFSAKSISADFALLKLFFKTYEISELSINQPSGIIIKNKETFNFDDIILRFSPDEKRDTTKEPLHFNIRGIKITNGTFFFCDELIPIQYSIKNVNIESSGKCWDNDSIKIHFTFQAGTGSGEVTGDIIINADNLNYELSVLVNNYNMQIIDQYLKEMSNNGCFSALLFADVDANGNFLNAENLNASGRIAIKDFHFGKSKEVDYASFETLFLDIIEISPMKHIYNCDTLLLSGPFFEYEQYDYLDNLQSMFGKDGANITAKNENAEEFNLVIEIVNYVKILSKNFFKSNYRVNKMAILNGKIRYNDYSINEKFSIDLCPLNVTADSIDKHHKRVNVVLRSGIIPYGNVSVSLSINPEDSSDFDIVYHLENLPAAMFNPYIITYTSYPLDRGTIELKGVWNVRNGRVQSTNHLTIIDPRVARHSMHKDAKWIPMPLIMTFIRERGNVIDYEIPITGDLNDPRFIIKDMIIDLIKNIFIKPATTPYRMIIRNAETKIEKSLSLKWKMRNSSVLPYQEIFIEDIADFLIQNPDARITIQPKHYSIKEAEKILLFEAKKQYYMLTHGINNENLSRSDSERVEKLYIKDSLFVQFLNHRSKNTNYHTIQGKCSSIISSEVVNTRLKRLYSERENSFLLYFKNKGVEKQVSFKKGVDVIPYNGFSFYEIRYNGQYPESLLNAFLKMDELNTKGPRKKFSDERKKNKKDYK